MRLGRTLLRHPAPPHPEASAINFPTLTMGGGRGAEGIPVTFIAGYWLGLSVVYVEEEEEEEKELL